MRKVYVYFQPNKKDIKDEYGDCVLRAICKATGMDWLQVFDSLVPYARTAQCLINQKPAYEAFLKDQGFKYTSFPIKRRPTLMEFRKTFKGTAICYVKVGYGTHLVSCSDGQYFDTWDSGDKYVYGYYEKV